MILFLSCDNCLTFPGASPAHPALTVIEPVEAQSAVEHISLKDTMMPKMEDMKGGLLKIRVKGESFFY